MKMPYTMSGKRGTMVYQRARYGQICYLAFIPVNPRTPAQVAGRGIFAAVSKRWRTLPQEHLRLWNAVARTMQSRPQIGLCGPLTGFSLFVKINVTLTNCGLPQIDLPPAYLQSPQQAASGLSVTNPVGRASVPASTDILAVTPAPVSASCQATPGGSCSCEPVLNPQ